MRNEATEKIEPVLPQRMRHAVKDHGVKAGIAENDLEDAADGGIAFKYNLEILFQICEHSTAPDKQTTHGQRQTTALRISYPIISVNYISGYFCQVFIHRKSC
jgi:hypothetical protein